MDTGSQYPVNSLFPDKGLKVTHCSERSRSFEEHQGNDDGWQTISVILSGGAPWGFTLRGGLEHTEPLLITKVEEGSKAASARLQAGDELLNINSIPLSGFRQEAICLVKGSHKTLSLVVKRKMKMVDIVAQKMPSESDVHMARSFLTKILRSSMRRNEPVSRPHSWHATKFNESHTETKAQSAPSPVWQTRYDASSSSSDFSTEWDQTNLHRGSDHFSSLGSMDSLEHCSHPYPAGRLSPSKSNNNSIEHLGCGKRDSAYSSFSTSSGTPDYTLSKSNTASTENMVYKINQWDSGGRHSNGRHTHNLNEAVRQDDSIGCLQHSLNTSSHEIPRNEDQAGTRHSSSGRVGIGPVWHVPDVKKSIISPTPPPTPPTRSDSFAATKVHEKGFSTGISEVHGAHAQLKPQTKGLQKMNETYETKTSLETQHNYHPPSSIEPSHVYMSSEAHHHYPHSVSPSTAYSQSTTEIRDRYSFHPSGLSNPRLCGDEATFHAQTRTVPVLKPPFSGYFSSMQELPTNNQAHLFKQSQDRRPAASLSGFTADPEGSIQSCYYAVTSHCTPQGITQASLVRVDDSKAFPIANISHNGRERMSVGSQGASKEKYLPPQSQHNDPEKTTDNHSHVYTTPGIPLNGPNFTANKLCELRGNLKQDPISNSDMHSISYPLTKHPDHKRAAGHHTPKEFLQPTNVIKSEAKLCPQKTPMLYSLAQEHCDVGLVPDELNSGSSQQEALEIQNGKHARRSDRFATTLRNEIQMRRAQLQKSRSAAALGSPVEIIEEAIPQKSTESSSPSADCCFSSSYKDHLKEAQARVLQATSFRRKDLEPVLFDHLGSEVVSRKDIPPFLSISEVPSTSGSNQVLRIGGRKRFSTEKKVLSVSEPDKINEMGSDKYLSVPDNVTLLEKNQKVFEATRKPTFPKPTAKPHLHISEENRLSKPRLQCLPNTDTAGFNKSGPATIKKHFNDGSDYSHSANQDDVLEHHRLGTFAEYEAKWNNQKTLEQKGSGKYHSADNILDTGNEDLNQPSCRHERSRSSPSADFYGQKLPVQEMKSAIYSDPVRHWPEQEKENIRLSEHGYCEKTEPQHPALTEDPKKPSSHSKPTLQTSDYSVCSEPSTIIKPKIPVLLPNVQQSPEESSPPPLGKPLEIHLGSGAAAGTALCTINSQTSAPVSRKGTAHKEEPFSEEELQQEPVPPPFPPPPPPAALPTTGPNQTTMEGQRSPSPQFAPQRLTDKPPVSVSIQDEAPERIDEIKEENTHVKKVPIKIVHSETSSEKESRQFLNLPTDSVLSSHGPGVTPLQSLGNPDQSYSLFCTYTRQKDLESEPRESLMGPLNDQELQSTANTETNAIHGLQISTSLDQSNEVSVHDDEKQEKLVRDIMDKDKSLVDILDQNKLKTTMDMMEGLFPQGDQLLEEAQQRRKASNKLVGPRTTIEKKEDDSMVAATALVTNSTYYSTSAPKAELLIKMKDMQELSVEDNSEEELEEDNEKELASKKQELISSLSRKLQVLREAQESLQEDVQDNNALGEDVEAIVQDVCKPNELEKFRMFVGDLDKVVNLLLSLSGRLARVENALNSLEEDVSLDEKRTLTDKRKLLIRQHEDAKELKENLDRRERVVYDILASYLPEESMADYEHFVKMKSALIIEQRKLEDKIKLGEEQLKCLMDSLPVDQMTNN